MGRLLTRVATFAIERGGLVAIAVLALYLWIAPHHIVDGDNAEFSTLGATGGVAHPSGYPLYVLWLRATSWLPSASPAHSAAIATAILGVLAVLTLHAACRAWGARPVAASITVGLFAMGPVVMRFHTEAEVFALNNLVVATVLWFSAATGPLVGTARIVGLTVVAGLGISNHLTCVLIAPVGILGIVRGFRETTHPRIPIAALAVATFAAGLLPYLYLLAAPTTVGSWAPIDDVGGLLHHFLREDYGGPGAFAPRGVPVPVVDNVVALANTVGRSWMWLPAVVGVAWLGLLARRGTDREPRWGWWMLALSLVVAGPLLASRFNKQLTEEGLYVISRFHMLPALLLAVPIATAIDSLGGRVVGRIRSPRLRTGAAGAALAIAVLVTSSALSLPRVTKAYSPAMERVIRNMLASLPPRAIVVGSFDLLRFGSAYVQSVLGERPDISVVGWPSTRANVLRRTGISIAHVASDHMATVRLAETLLASGRPVFADERVAAMLQELPSYPYGLVFRVLPRDEAAPALDEVFAMNKTLYSAFVFGYPRPHVDDGFPAETHRWYGRAWRILAGPLAAAGRRDDAAFALEMERAVAPVR
jgi:Protein of unknown function (DUF2723)